MRFLRFALAPALLLVLSGCPKRVAPPTETLEDAAAKAGPGASAHVLALAGFHALLMDGDAKRAQQLFDDSVAKDPSEALALFGQIEMAQRLALPQKVLAAALDLVERQPEHPLAPIAARLVLEIATSAKSTSETVRARVPALLAKEQQPDTAHLLRAALANCWFELNDTAKQAELLADMGTPTTGTLVGPFSPWHVLATQEPVAPEKDGSLANLTPGPFGPLMPRTLKFADGRFALSGEPPTGDIYLYVVDVTVPEKARYVLRTVSTMDHVALIDGAKVLSRFSSRRPASTLTTRALKLDAGTHRLMLRVARESQNGQLVIALQRADGSPSKLTFAPASGAAPKWDGDVKLEDDAEGLYPTAESVRRALEDEGGDALAGYLAARDAQGRDGDGALALLAGLPESLKGPAVSVLRAEASLEDRSVPTRVGRGRATRELEAALVKDPGYVIAKMATAQLALDDGRQLDALEQARMARDAHSPAGAPVLQLIARVELAMGLDAQAVVTTRAAEAALPGACDSLLLQYDLARRRDAVKEADELLGKTAHCAGYLSRSAEHLRGRGEIGGAIAQYEAMLARDEGQVGVATVLAGLYTSQKRFDDATKLLQRLRAQWPRHPQLPKTLGDVLEVQGDAKGALAAREAALVLDGTDLVLRRAIERSKTGKELLEQWAISTEDALKSYEAAPGSEDATTAFVLDAAAIQAFPDGTMVDRVHIIQKALDQQGVQTAAEVEIPAGATVLKLRTLKPDGRALEPENIDGKEDMSLPGVQVGDLVEYEYLLAHPTRGPGLPGFTAGAFYFQVARTPNARSNYVVIAPKGSGMEVDAHNVKAPKPQLEGEFEVLRHEERRVPAYIPEPLGPPSANEWLPFVSVGAGQKGNDGVIRSYADAFFERGAVTWEVEAFARNAVKDLKTPLGVDAVKAIYAAVHHKLSGRDGGLAISASASVSQDRGSRTWLLKSSLDALGFEARLVAVRAFTSDPAPYTFPNEGLLPYICVRVTIPGGEPVWLDALVRFAPFGELPEFALGGLDAWVLPEPGKPMEQTITPSRLTRPGKSVTLDLTLNEAGELVGKGEETYSGSEAAQLAEALESLSADQRDQALQSALARYFGGADLSKLEVKMDRDVGAPVVVKYEFIARRFARAEGNKLIAASLTYPLMVGRRFLAVPARVTPLFIEASEASSTKATLTLPAGWSLQGPVPEVKLEGPSGTYLRHETQKANQLIIEEEFRLTQSRVPTKQYDAFAQFAGEVDLVQQRDLLFVKK
ncbi:MAG: tetratricopeptide repeat protein [Archangium sp.]